MELPTFGLSEFAKSIEHSIVYYLNYIMSSMPSLCEVEGIGHDQIRSIYESACMFHNAAPWRVLRVTTRYDFAGKFTPGSTATNNDSIRLIATGYDKDPNIPDCASRTAALGTTQYLSVSGKTAYKSRGFHAFNTEQAVRDVNQASPNPVMYFMFMFWDDYLTSAN